MGVGSLSDAVAVAVGEGVASNMPGSAEGWQLGDVVEGCLLGWPVEGRRGGSGGRQLPRREDMRASRLGRRSVTAADGVG